MNYTVHVEYILDGTAKKSVRRTKRLFQALAVSDFYSALKKAGYSFGRLEIHRNGSPMLGLEPEMVNKGGDIVDSGLRRWHAIGEDYMGPEMSAHETFLYERAKRRAVKPDYERSDYMSMDD